LWRRGRAELETGQLLRLPDHGYEAVFLCLTRNWSWERVFFEITT